MLFAFDLNFAIWFALCVVLATFRPILSVLGFLYSALNKATFLFFTDLASCSLLNCVWVHFPLP